MKLRFLSLRAGYQNISGKSTLTLHSGTQLAISFFIKNTKHFQFQRRMESEKLFKAAYFK